MRQDKKRKTVNLSVKNAVKEAVKNFRKTLVATALPKVTSLLDIAVKKNVYHANKASRIKSRLSKLLAGAATAPKATAAKKSVAKPKRAAAAVKKKKAAKKSA